MMTAEETETATESPQQEPSQKPPLWRVMLNWICLPVCALAFSALLLRYFISDRWLFSEYLLWSPLWIYPAIFFLFVGGVYRLKRILIFTGIFLLLFFGAVINDQPRLLRVFSKGQESAGETYSLIAWNVMSYNRGKRPVLEGYKAFDTDFLFLLEGTASGKVPDFIETELSQDYDWHSTRQMVTASKYPVVSSEELETVSRVRMFRVEVEVEEGPLVLFLIDLPSPPRHDSNECFAELSEILSAETKPHVVVGDFNTPRGSALLSRTFDDYNDAYVETDGQRWLASFPDTLPFIQIDHVFMSRDLHPISADLISGDESDHFRQVVEFAFSDSSESNP